MPTERTVSYGVTITRSHAAPGWVVVSLRKHFWHVATGSRSRQVAEAGFYSEGMGEREILEGALREVLRAYVDELG